MYGRYMVGGLGRMVQHQLLVKDSIVWDPSLR